LGGRFVEPYIQLFYGTVYPFPTLSGVLWGFATKTSGAKPLLGIILAVPLGGAVAFFMTSAALVGAGLT